MSTFIKLTAILFISPLLLNSCKEGKKNKRDNEIIQAFRVSDSVIYRSTELVLKELEYLSFDPVAKEKAVIWNAKAVEINSSTNELLRTIDSLSQNLTDNPLIKAVYNKTIEYKKLHLQNEEAMINSLNDHFRFINRLLSLPANYNSSIKKTSEINTSENSTDLVLSILKNKLRIIENNYMSFCLSKSHVIIEDFDSYSMIAGQNANIFSPGSVLELKAGIGAFSRYSKPTISFGGKTVPINDEGFALYRKKVPATPGLYKIPIRVRFINPIFGKEEIKEVIVEYKVVKACD